MQNMIFIKLKMSRRHPSTMVNSRGVVRYEKDFIQDNGARYEAGRIMNDSSVATPMDENFREIIPRSPVSNSTMASSSINPISPMMAPNCLASSYTTSPQLPPAMMNYELSFRLEPENLVPSEIETLENIMRHGIRKIIEYINSGPDNSRILVYQYLAAEIANGNQELYNDVKNSKIDVTNIPLGKYVINTNPKWRLFVTNNENDIFIHNASRFRRDTNYLSASHSPMSRRGELTYHRHS